MNLVVGRKVVTHPDGAGEIVKAVDVKPEYEDWNAFLEWLGDDPTWTPEGGWVGSKNRTLTSRRADAGTGKGPTDARLLERRLGMSIERIKAALGV